MYLEKFGRPIYPFQRIRREVYKYQKQSHLEHIATLKKYLQIAPYIVPEDKVLSRPTLRHPDFQPNNIFISEDLEITGLIDWQHCTIMPLFLQCGIPNSFQNYGDDVSESLLTPVLPADFSNLNEHEQHEQAELLRRRQLHYFYVKATATRNPIHFNALTEDLSALRRKVFYHASDPWEGDNVSLKTDLIYLTKEWSKIIRQRASKDNDGSISCPIAFSEDEVKNCLQLHTAQLEADEQFEACRDVVGVGPEGWVPNDQYDDAKQRERKLKADALEAAESADEREEICENWIFDDFDEEDYL